MNGGCLGSRTRGLPGLVAISLEWTDSLPFVQMNRDDGTMMDGVEKLAVWICAAPAWDPSQAGGSSSSSTRCDVGDCELQ